MGAQKADVLPCIAQQGLPGAPAVGHPGGIAEVNEILMGKQLPQSPDSRQAAEARIKNADGSIVHRTLLTERRRTLLSDAASESYIIL